MRVEITLERLVEARKSRPSRWRHVATATFKSDDQGGVMAWMAKHGMPPVPTVGWAVRAAMLP